MTLKAFNKEEEALLDAIRSQPEDNTVRLVYADWLDEHNKPERAEFIRTQILKAGKEKPKLTSRQAKQWFTPWWVRGNEAVGIGLTKYFVRIQPRYGATGNDRTGPELVVRRGFVEKVVRLPSLDTLTYAQDGKNITCIFTQPVTHITIRNQETLAFFDLIGEERYGWETRASPAALSRAECYVVSDISPFLSKGIVVADGRRYRSRVEANRDLSEACTKYGKEQFAKWQRRQACKTCNGSGYVKDHVPYATRDKCPACSV